MCGFITSKVEARGFVAFFFFFYGKLEIDEEARVWMN